MKKMIKNKLVMYKRVSDILHTNGTIWGGIPAFVLSVDDLNDKIHALEEKETMQQSVTIGVSAVKDQIKKEKIDEIYRISSALLALATTLSDEKLRKEMKFTYYTLSSAPRVELISKIDLIIDRAQTNVSALSDFGIGGQDVSALQTLRSELDTHLLNPRKAISTRKGLNAEIITLSKEIDFLLSDGIDRLMFVLKSDHPPFFAAYTEARYVIDYHHGNGNSNTTN